MFFTRGITANRILSTLTHVIKVPIYTAGLYLNSAGWGALESNSGAGGTFDLSEHEGYFQVLAESVGAGDKYRCVVLSNIYDLTAFNKLYVQFATVSGTVGSKYFTIGAVRSTQADLNATDPDISLLDVAGATYCKQATPIITTHAIQSQAVDISDLTGNCNIFFEVYCSDSMAGDDETLKVYSVVLEA